jgi:EF hand
MDRNRDGDISRREFLGPRADFDRLDRDRDGLIDAQEAENARPK